MLDRHVAYLDAVTVLQRLRHHKRMSRTNVLHALIEFMERSGIDFSRFATGAELTQHLGRYFGDRVRRGEAQIIIPSDLLASALPVQGSSDNDDGP